MEIKLIVSDVDGTLIDVTESFSPDFYSLVDTIKTNKCNITLASGRCYGQLEKFVSALGVDLPVIINNGAGCVKNGELIWENVISHNYIKQAILKADELDMAIIISDGYTDRVYRHNAYIQNQIDKFDRYQETLTPRTDDEWKNLHAQKLLIIDPKKPGSIDDIIKLLQPYADELNIVRYNDRSVDVMLKNSSKANGVARLSELLKVDVENVMAVGDERNDIEMIDLVGLGVAVSNADQSLKSRADYICIGANAKGVLEAIEKFYLIKN